MILIGLAVALVLAEGAVRVADRRHCLLYFSGNFWEPNRFYGWGLTPGAFGWAKRCLGRHVEWETFTRINSLGRRDREIPYARTAAPRVLVLGDSYTEGVQVPVSDTFAKRLERRLSEAAGRPVEVVNAGTSGYGTDNELLFYRHEGRRYRPDVVLLVFSTQNDVYENYLPLLQAFRFAGYGRKPYFLPAAGRLVLHDFPLPAEPRHTRLLMALSRSAYRHSALYRWLRSLSLPRLPRAARLLTPAVARAGAPPPLTVTLVDLLRRRYSPEWIRGWQVTRALLRRLRRETARDGARLVVAVLPSAWEVSPQRLDATLALSRQLRHKADFDADKPTRLVERFLGRRRIRHRTLLPGLRAHLAATGRSGYFDFDVHLTAEGHGVVTELLVPVLLEEVARAPAGARSP